jgi:hypothetical protein
LAAITSRAEHGRGIQAGDIARSYDVSRSTNFYVKGMIEPHAATTPRGRKAKLSPKEEFHAAIGRFVLEWAGLEFCLDLLLLAARSRDKATQRKPKLPHQFAAKIALIRSETKELDSAHQAVISDLLDDISSYADTRHDFCARFDYRSLHRARCRNSNFRSAAPAPASATPETREGDSAGNNRDFRSHLRVR